MENMVAFFTQIYLSPMIISNYSPNIAMEIGQLPRWFRWFTHWVTYGGSFHRFLYVYQSRVSKCPNFSHHPNIGDIISNRYDWKVMWNTSPKWENSHNLNGHGFNSYVKLPEGRLVNYRKSRFFIGKIHCEWAMVSIANC